MTDPYHMSDNTLYRSVRNWQTRCVIQHRHTGILPYPTYTSYRMFPPLSSLLSPADARACCRTSEKPTSAHMPSKRQTWPSDRECLPDGLLAAEIHWKADALRLDHADRLNVAVKKLERQLNTRVETIRRNGMKVDVRASWEHCLQVSDHGSGLRVRVDDRGSLEPYFVLMSSHSIVEFESAQHVVQHVLVSMLSIQQVYLATKRDDMQHTDMQADSTHTHAYTGMHSTLYEVAAQHERNSFVPHLWACPSGIDLYGCSGCAMGRLPHQAPAQPEFERLLLIDRWSVSMTNRTFRVRSVSPRVSMLLVKRRFYITCTNGWRANHCLNVPACTAPLTDVAQ